MGGKVNYYKRENGNWKSARAEMSVTCGGEVRQGYVCGNARNFLFSQREPQSGFKKRNRISTRKHSPYVGNDSKIWKTYPNKIGMNFDLPGIAQGNLVLTF